LYKIAKMNYILVVSAVTAAVSTIDESVIVVSIVDIVVSVIVESVESADFSDEQAATDKESTRAKKPNLNKFFIMFCFRF
jgi:hypothetical protein